MKKSNRPRPWRAGNIAELSNGPGIIIQDANREVVAIVPVQMAPYMNLSQEEHNQRARDIASIIAATPQATMTREEAIDLVERSYSEGSKMCKKVNFKKGGASLRDTVMERKTLDRLLKRLGQEKLTDDEYNQNFCN